MEESIIKKRYVIAFIATSIIGFVISFYLADHNIRINYGFENTSSFCSVSSLIDCDAVAASRYSKIFGLPTASFGMAFFALLIFLALSGLLYRNSYLRLHLEVSFFFVGASLLISLYLAYISFFVIKTICILCIATYIITILNLIFIKNALDTKLRDILSTALHDIRTLMSFKEPGSGAYFFHVKLIGILIIISCLSFPFIKKALLLDENISFVHQKYIELYKSEKAVSIDISQSPVLGNTNARNILVEFADYECPACRATFYPLKMILPQYRDRVKFVFKHFPLPYHTKALPASNAALCAENQGKFWEYHAKLFEGGLEQSDLKEYAEELGLDVNAFTLCVSNQEFASRIEADITEGSSIGVQGTPTLFLNGKQIKGKPTVAFLNELLSNVITESDK